MDILGCAAGGKFIGYFITVLSF